VTYRTRIFTEPTPDPVPEPPELSGRPEIHDPEPAASGWEPVPAGRAARLHGGLLPGAVVTIRPVPQDQEAPDGS